MADSMKFSRVDKPSSIGTSCWTCLTSAHPDGFYQINKPAAPVIGFGTPCLCADCVYELAREAGCLDPRQAQQLRDVADEIAGQVDRLTGELEDAKQNMVVPLAEVIDFLEERAKRRPDPAPTGKRSA